MSKFDGKTVLKVISCGIGSFAVFKGSLALYDGFIRYDRQGYDKEGYDRCGFDKNGYNREGRDKRGFDRNGFDAEGYDYQGYDAEGYSRYGYSRDGFDRQGYDRDGYNKNFYNSEGYDRAGRSAQDYTELLGSLYVRHGDAKRKLDSREFRYAIQDARLVLEETLRLIVGHACGLKAVEEKLADNLATCVRKKLLDVDSDFISRLHGVRAVCNATLHEMDASTRLTHEKTYFVLMQTHEFLKMAEDYLVGV